MERLNLRQLEIFSAVVDAGSFTAAAEKLYLAQSTVSDNVRALETAPVGASGEEEMRYYHDVVAADMDAVRDTVDRLETLTAGKYWPYPTFYDLLFSV